MKKKLYSRFLALIFSAVILAACGGQPISEKVIGEIVDPPALPVMSDPTPLAVGQQVEITDGETTLTLENLGKDSSGQNQWICLDEGGESCAERHGNEAEMVFYYEFKLVGATLGNSFMLTLDWGVKLYP